MARAAGAANGGLAGGMVVRQKVSPEQIREALVVYRGNVTAVADYLRLNRHTLYRRIVTLVARGKLSPLGAYRLPSVPTRGHRCLYGQSNEGAQRSVGGAWRGGAGAPTLHSGGEMNAMQSPHIGELVQGSATYRPLRSPRLSDSTLHRICQARLKLQAVRGIESTDAALLEELIDAQLDSWLAQQLAVARDQP